MAHWEGKFSKEDILIVKEPDSYHNYAKSIYIIGKTAFNYYEVRNVKAFENSHVNMIPLENSSYFLPFKDVENIYKVSLKGKLMKL